MPHCGHDRSTVDYSPARLNDPYTLPIMGRRWNVAVVFDVLVPLVIGTVIVVVLILAFVESSPNYP